MRVWRDSRIVIYTSADSLTRSALELGLSEHADHPVLSPTYDPATLARSALLAKDIRYLLTLLPSHTSSTTGPTPLPSDPSTPLPPFPLPAFLASVFSSPPPGLETYLSHLRDLSRTRPEGLLAHSYVRYLGDMSGGQFISARVKRAYALPKLEGTEFYHFNQDGKAVDVDEKMADTKRRLGEIKDWFRRGMDEGVADDVQAKRECGVTRGFASFWRANIEGGMMRIDVFP